MTRQEKEKQVLQNIEDAKKAIETFKRLDSFYAFNESAFHGAISSLSSSIGKHQSFLDKLTDKVDVGQLLQKLANRESFISGQELWYSLSDVYLDEEQIKEIERAGYAVMLRPACYNFSYTTYYEITLPKDMAGVVV